MGSLVDVGHVTVDERALSAFCRRRHVAKLAVFGSVLRDDFGPDSDVGIRHRIVHER
jgi:hypothetical protein